MEFKQIINHILDKFKSGIQYKKAGENISLKSDRSNDCLHVGAKIKYNARSVFHSVK